MRAFLLLAAALPLLAVDGTVINATSGKPQAGVLINLVQPGQAGMASLGQATTGADGTFHIDKEIPPGPALLQSIFGGVMYTQPVPPGTPASGLKISVYDSTSTPPPGMSTQHLILIEPSATQLHISETFYTRNESNLTFQDNANGSVRLYLPPGAPEDLKVTINSTGVPIQRALEKGKAPGQYKISYALKPGETRFDLDYNLPATATFSGKVFSTTPPVKLVTAESVTLSGDGIKDLGQEPQTKARVYSFDGSSFKATISGVGSLRGPETEAAPSPEESGAPKCCEETPARVYSQMPWVLGLGFGILAVGGTLLFRKGQA
ncbi:MAG: hypothetical protein WDO18_03575 [Acidobacteriota bacterium]